MTSLQLSNFIKLEACDKVVGITSTRHLFNKEMNERLKSGKTAKIGIEGNFDNEVIMSVNPDVIFYLPLSSVADMIRCVKSEYFWFRTWDIRK
mgnify:CR=1 FL=1